MPASPDLTPEQFSDLLASIAKDVVPADAPVPSALDRLSPYRDIIVAYRKRGFNATQLSAMLQDPRFPVHASASTVQRLIAGPKKKKRASGPVKYNVTPSPESGDRPAAN